MISVGYHIQLINKHSVWFFVFPVFGQILFPELVFCNVHFIILSTVRPSMTDALSITLPEILFINPYPADQNFRLLRLPPNITKVLFHTFIHTLPTVTKLYATISSCTACQTYQKLHKIYYIFFHSCFA